MSVTFRRPFEVSALTRNADVYHRRQTRLVSSMFFPGAQDFQLQISIEMVDGGFPF